MTAVGNIVEQLLTDQRRQWRNGAPVPVESYLDRHPELRARTDVVVELIGNEVVLRQQHGEAPQLTEYLERFGEYQDHVCALFETDRTVAGPSEEAAFAQFCAPHTPQPRSLPAVPGYEVLAELGRGGMGVVYKARQTLLNREVALKMILDGRHADPVVRSRFRTEAFAIARLQHANIVQIHEVGEHEDRPFLALEFVAGGSLEARIASTPQPEPEAAQLVETLARAVHYTHERGILHRDLKPGNILLAADGTPKISDFGLAKLRDADADLTRTNAVLGTPNYMPPELAAGNIKNLGVSADVYSLGAILYVLLTGRPPFAGTTLLKTLDQVRYQEPVCPHRLRGRMSADLETICLKCLEKVPAKRYASAEALADDLRRFREGQSIQARPIGPWRRAWRWTRRRPMLAAVVLGLAALACFTWVAVSYVQVAEKLGERRADDQYQEFIQCRDEAFFYGLLSPVEGALFLGAEAGVNLKQAESAARRALALAGVDPRGSGADLAPPFPAARKAETIADCHGLLLLLAGVRGQQEGPERFQEALRILDRAGQLGMLSRSLCLRRAYFLEKLGKSTEADRARVQAQAMPADGAADHFLIGEDLYRRGRWDDARSAFGRALTAQPAHFWARFFQAVCHLKAERWDAAKEGFNGSLSQKPDFVWAYLFRSIANERLQAADEAAADFRKALQLNPKEDARYVLQLTRGILHFHQKEWESAAVDFRAAQALKPDQYNAYLNLAHIFIAQKRFEEADAEMAKVFRLHPPAAVVVGYHVERGRNLLRDGKAAETVRACDEALELSPHFAAALGLRGQALLALGRFEQAEAALDRFIEAGGNTSADTFRARGQARMKLGKYADAVDDYTRALERSADADIYQHRGWAHFFADAWKLAVRDFSRAIELDPEAGDAFTGRGLARVMLGDYRQAVADADRALQLKPATPHMMHNLACLFAQACARVRADDAEPQRHTLRSGYCTRALQAIRKTLEALPEPERAAFWHDVILPDAALAPVRVDVEFQRLQRIYSSHEALRR